jgi:hypothetical protein
MGDVDWRHIMGQLSLGFEWQRILTPLRVSHPGPTLANATQDRFRNLSLLVNLNVRPQRNIPHALRRDEDELPADGPPGRLYHHAHANVTIDVVHEDITDESQLVSKYQN